MAEFAVSNKFKGAASTLYCVTDGRREFVVQVVNRHSTILRAHIKETNVWAAPVVDNGKGRNPTLAKFDVAAVESRPVLRLPVASVDAACDALNRRGRG